METTLTKLWLSIGWFVLLVITGYASYDVGYQRAHDNQELEIKKCAEEVSLACPNVTTYAVMLEKENARLNKLCKRKAQKSEN